MKRQKGKLVYPMFASEADLCWFRIAGAGLGNCLLTYFESVLYAHTVDGRLIQPAWPSIKIGPLLRGERSNRFYGGLMRPGPGEMNGLAKAMALIHRFGGKWSRQTLGETAEVLSNGRIDIVRSLRYSFDNLLSHRDFVRERFLEISRPKLPLNAGWGKGNYIAAHIRLGDFAVVSHDELTAGIHNNFRIPLDWYKSIILDVRNRFPTYPVFVYSDGKESELSLVLSLPGVELRREESDLADMAALAGSRLLIGSRSTFSYWGAFLGDMPAIWFKTEMAPLQLSSSKSNQILIGNDATSLPKYLERYF